MEHIYKLKDKLIKEIGNYADAQLTTGVIDTLEKASTTAKNLCKIIELCEESEGGYSGRTYEYSGDGSYRDGEMSYRDGGSYARGRRRAPRDSMGRYSGYSGYSRDGYSRHSGKETAEEIRNLMGSVQDEEARREMEHLVKMLER